MSARLEQGIGQPDDGVEAAPAPQVLLEPHLDHPEKGTRPAVLCGRRIGQRYLPTASETHFFEKLDLAAPASFLSAAALSQLAAASFWHLVIKEFNAAPANFFAVACAWHDDAVPCA